MDHAALFSVRDHGSMYRCDPGIGIFHYTYTYYAGICLRIKGFMGNYHLQNMPESASAFFDLHDFLVAYHHRIAYHLPLRHET